MLSVVANESDIDATSVINAAVPEASAAVTVGVITSRDITES